MQRCPNCGKSLKADAAICPGCDHILDESILGGSHSTAPGDDADAGDTPPHGSDPVHVEDEHAHSPTTEIPQQPAPKVGTPQPAKRPQTGPRPTLPQRPVSKPANKPLASAARKPASKFAQPAPDDEEEDSRGGRDDDTARRARDDDEDSDPPARGPGPSALVKPNKYQTVGDQREPEATNAINAEMMAKQPAPVTPPLDPEVFFRNLASTLLNLPFEEKIEVFGSIVMMLMTFMPWRSLKGDDDIGLLTWGGFWCGSLAAGLLGVYYLRHTRRISTFPVQMLNMAELALAGLSLPTSVLFILFSVDWKQTKGIMGSTTTYTSMPSFGAFLGLLCGVAMTAGAALCFQRIKKRGS